MKSECADYKWMGVNLYITFNNVTVEVDSKMYFGCTDLLQIFFCWFVCFLNIKTFS